MRLLLALSAIVIKFAIVSAAATDLCTTTQMSEFTTALKAASSCLAAAPYNWGGIVNPTKTQFSVICTCAPASVSSIPACSVVEGPDRVTLEVHFDWVLKTQCANVTAVPSANATDAPTNTPTSAPPASAPSAAAADLCTVVQISAVSSALQTASSCLSSTSYNWGGPTNPTSAEYAAICKCPSVSELSIPACSVVKGSNKVLLSAHYDWVLHTQCPILVHGNNKSSSNTGLVVGVVGGVVVIFLVMGSILWQCKRSANKDEHLFRDDAHGMRSTVAFHPMNGTPQYTNKNFDEQPSVVSTVGTTSTTFPPSGTGSDGTSSTRSAETGKWDDPVIMAIRIPFDAIFVGALLSRGAFGEVHRGMYRGETVAIKSLLPDRRKDLAQIDDFLSEVKLMSSLEHERIVKFIGVAWNSLSDACMVVEFMENGDLRSMLAHALVFLHSLEPDVVHRDLKSKIVLLDTNLDAKVTDFGISRERADETMTAGVGSSLWMAPEVMMGQRYDEKADIFSFGVVLSELDTHQLPYFHAKVSESGQKLPEAAILQQVMLGHLRVVFTSSAHPDLVQLGRECVSLDPKNRPTTAQVLHRVHLVMRQFRELEENAPLVDSSPRAQALG